MDPSALERSITSLDTSLGRWGVFIMAMTALVGVGLILECIYEIPEALEERREKKNWKPLLIIAGVILITVGVLGEFVGEFEAGDKETQLRKANDQLEYALAKEVESAQANAKGAAAAAARANDEVDKAQKKVRDVAEQAEEIDRGLSNTKWMISRMFVQDLNGLAGELKSEFKGRQIVLKSYSGDEGAYWTCEQLVDIAHKAEMNPQDRCASEPTPNIPVVDVLVGAPSLQEAERMSSLLTKPGRLAVLSVSLNQTSPVLSVMVGKKRSFVAWPPTKDDSKHKAAKTSVRP